MGLGKFVRKIVRKVFRAVGIGGGGGSGGGSDGGSGGGSGSPSQPTPAPRLELQNTQGEAEEKEEPKKVQRRKGKKALKITKKDAPVMTSVGRNIV